MAIATKMSALGVCAFLFFTACNNNSNTSETKSDSSSSTMETVRQDAKNAAAEVKEAFTKNDDSDFVVKAALANNTELKMLEAGEKMGANKELKAHAKQMMADHKKLGASVAAYASKKGYALPADDEGKSQDKLNSMKGKKGLDWDKAWTDDMLSAHEDAVSLFDTNSGKVKDDELKKLISDALPTLRMHRDMMKQLQDKLKK
jgi:putative membrane protein